MSDEDAMVEAEKYGISAGVVKGLVMNAALTYHNPLKANSAAEANVLKSAIKSNISSANKMGVVAGTEVAGEIEGHLKVKNNT